jgi:DNA-binding LacI/PurR family transcriptional regulator
MVTMKDLAREVGLSVTTVSRALNDYDDVSETTKARIREAARRLDYHPNAVARSLQNRRANAIGLVIPRVLHRTYDAFWLEFIGGAAEACVARGVDLLMVATDDQASQGFQRVARGRRVDGLILCDVRRMDPRVAYLKNHGLPFVSFGRTIDDTNFSYIDVDGAAGAATAVEHLIRLGHRRIAYLGIDPDFSFSYFRLKGYQQSLEQASVPVDPALIHEGLTELTAPAVVHSLLTLPAPPTAIFASADFLGMAVVKAAREAGLEIPGDLSVCVFDDSPLVQHVDPPLTAVSQPNRRLGEEAARLLLDSLDTAGGPLVQRLVIPALVIRQSTAGVRPDAGRAAAG